MADAERDGKGFQIFALVRHLFIRAVVGAALALWVVKKRRVAGAICDHKVENERMNSDLVFWGCIWVWGKGTLNSQQTRVLL